MSSPRQFHVLFRLRQGNSPQQRTVVTATDLGTARRLFEQQNPGVIICSIAEILGR